MQLVSHLCNCVCSEKVLDAPLPSSGRVPFRHPTAAEGSNSEEGYEAGGVGFRRNQAASSSRARGHGAFTLVSGHL